MKHLLAVVTAISLLLFNAQSTTACIVLRPFAEEIKSADVVIRASLTEYTMIEPHEKVRLRLQIVESIFGARQRGEIVAVWVSKIADLQESWDKSADVLVALKRLAQADGAAQYEVIQAACGPPSILEFNAVNVWRLSEAIRR